MSLAIEKIETQIDLSGLMTIATINYARDLFGDTRPKHN
jgi:hypothetical protein